MDTALFSVSVNPYWQTSGALTLPPPPHSKVAKSFKTVQAMTA